MRQLLVFLVWLGLAPVAFAAEGWFPPFAKPASASSTTAPNCVTPIRPDCGAPGHPHHCRCQTCCQDVPCRDVPCVPVVPREGPPTDKEVPPQLEYLPRESGAYVAPPRVGVTREAVVQRGMETGAITFPELKLKFPCIELPACFVSRSQARMHVESGIAPWESHGIVNAAAGTNEALLLKRIAGIGEVARRKGSTGHQGNGFGRRSGSPRKGRRRGLCPQTRGIPTPTRAMRKATRGAAGLHSPMSGAAPRRPAKIAGWPAAIAHPKAIWRAPASPVRCLRPQAGSRSQRHGPAARVPRTSRDVCQRASPVTARSALDSRTRGASGADHGDTAGGAVGSKWRVIFPTNSGRCRHRSGCEPARAVAAGSRAAGRRRPRGPHRRRDTDRAPSPAIAVAGRCRAARSSIASPHSRSLSPRRRSPRASTRQG